MHYELMSGDDHLDLSYLPAKLWEEGLPAAWRDRAPRVVTANGRTNWVKEGAVWGYHGSRHSVGDMSPLQVNGVPEEPERGVYRPSTAKYRLQDMDGDGIYAQVIYPLLQWGFKDFKLKDACIVAYNTWLAGFCQASPDRLIGQAVLPTDGAEEATQEVYRIAELGLRGAVFDAFAGKTPIFDPMWEPLWSAAEETGLVISAHIAGGWQSLPLPKDGKHGTGSWAILARTGAFNTQMDEILTSVVFSGILERHPKLRVVLGESGIGWIPFVLEKMDFEHRIYYQKTLPEVRLKSLPSEQFRRQMCATFQDDRVGVRLIPDVGVENVMWASDYPHPDGTYPKSRQAVAEAFAASTGEIRRKATWENTARVYGVRAPVG